MYIELVEKYQWSGGSMVSSDQALIPTQLLLGEDPSIWGNKSNASNITATVIMMMIVGAITLQPITICATKRNVQMMASQEMEQKYLFCSHTHRCHFFPLSYDHFSWDIKLIPPETNWKMKKMFEGKILASPRLAQPQMQNPATSRD